MSGFRRRALTSASALVLGIAGAAVASGPAMAATSLAETGSTGLPLWVPLVGGIVLLAGIGFVVFSVITRRKTVTGRSEGDVGLGETGAGTGGDALFPEASTAPPTAQPPAENDPR